MALTKEQIAAEECRFLTAHAQFIGAGDVWIEGVNDFARAIESAATAPLLERIAELERLCDATYVANGSDAYNHACSEMERWQAERAKAGKEVGTEGSLCDGMAWLYQALAEKEASIAALTAQVEQAAQPIDMVLHCPACGMQHVDAPSPTDGQNLRMWSNPPHKSHLCRPEDGGCGHIWRPADVPTNGVAAIKTNGKADSRHPVVPRPQPVHYRALLAEEQRPHQLKTAMHVVGFRTWKAADDFVASERDMNGWRYTIEPLYTAPPKAVPLTDEQQILRSLLGAALGALRYHTAQTRPIERTNETIRAIEHELSVHGITPATVEKEGE